VATEVRRFVRTQIDELLDSREPQVLAGIISDFRVINGQRGKLGLFKLDDKSAVIEASADEALLNTYRNQLKEDEFVVMMGRLQLDHFSGGLRVKVQGNGMVKRQSLQPGSKAFQGSTIVIELT